VDVNFIPLFTVFNSSSYFNVIYIFTGTYGLKIISVISDVTTLRTKMQLFQKVYKTITFDNFEEFFRLADFYIRQSELRNKESAG